MKEGGETGTSPPLVGGQGIDENRGEGDGQFVGDGFLNGVTLQAPGVGGASQDVRTHTTRSMSKWGSHFLGFRAGMHMRLYWSIHTGILTVIVPLFCSTMCSTM
jgi:hypothetical protein